VSLLCYRTPTNAENEGIWETSRIAMENIGNAKRNPSETLGKEEKATYAKSFGTNKRGAKVGTR